MVRVALMEAGETVIERGIVLLLVVLLDLGVRVG